MWKSQLVPIQGEYQHIASYTRDPKRKLHFYTGAMIRDLTVEQYGLLRMDQHSPNWEGTHQLKL